MKASQLFKAVVAAALISFGANGRALDFQPTSSFRVLENARIPVLLFPDGDRTIRYEPPDGWGVVGEGASISFRPRAIAQAELRLAVAAKSPKDAGNAVAKVPLPKDLVAGLLPADATEVVPVAENENPFLLETIGSRESVFAYTSDGQRFRISIATCDFNATQWLSVVTKALERDFEIVRGTAIGSLFSWTAQ